MAINKPITAAEKVAAAKRLAAESEKDHELMTGIFHYLEHRGGTLDFRFHKYAGDDYTHYSLTDGMRYKLPRMVIKHINTGIYYLKYKKLENEKGDFGMHAAAHDGRIKTTAQMMQIEKDYRCSFSPLDFMNEDLDLIPSKIVQVEARVG
jgi:hypothetical protein